MEKQLIDSKSFSKIQLSGIADQPRQKMVSMERSSSYFSATSNPDTLSFDSGIIQRVITEVYKKFETPNNPWKKVGCLMKCAFLEIYNDSVTDLLL